MKEPFRNPATNTWTIAPAKIENSKEVREVTIGKHWTDWTDNGPNLYSEKREFNRRLEIRRYDNLAANALISSIEFQVKQSKIIKDELDLLSSSEDNEKKITITINDSALGQQLSNAFRYLRRVAPQPQPDKIVLMANNNFIDYSMLFYMLNNIEPFTIEMKTNLEQFFKLNINHIYYSANSSERHCMLFTPRPLKQLAKLATRLKGLEKLTEDIQKLSLS